MSSSFVNPAYRRLMGERDFIGRTVQAVAPEARDQGYLEILDRVYRTGERCMSPRKPITLKRGNTAALEQRLLTFVYEPIVDQNGTVTGIFVEGFDVTEIEDSDRLLSGTRQQQRRENSGRWKPLFGSSTATRTFGKPNIN